MSSMKDKKIILAADHAGFELKEKIKEFLAGKNFVVEDLGTNNPESVDYPDYAIKVGKALGKEKEAKGILICGSGIGMSIAANKVKGVRAAVCHSEKAAELARLHNDANLLCLGSRLTDEKDAIKIVEKFFGTEFTGEERHKRRIEKLHKAE